MSPLLSVVIVFLMHFFTHLTFQWKSKHEELVCKSLRAARSHNRSHRISFFHFIFTQPLHTTLLDLLATGSHCLHFLGQVGQQLFALAWATQRGQQWSALSWETQLLLWICCPLLLPFLLPTLLSPTAAACTTGLSCLCFGCCCVSDACSTGLSCQMPLSACVSNFCQHFQLNLSINCYFWWEKKTTKLSFNNENLNPHKFKLRYTRFLSHITRTSYSKLPC